MRSQVQPRRRSTSAGARAPNEQPTRMYTREHCQRGEEPVFHRMPAHRLPVAKAKRATNAAAQMEVHRKQHDDPEDRRQVQEEPVARTELIAQTIALADQFHETHEDSLGKRCLPAHAGRPAALNFRAARYAALLAMKTLLGSSAYSPKGPRRS